MWREALLAKKQREGRKFNITKIDTKKFNTNLKIKLKASWATAHLLKQKLKKNGYYKITMEISKAQQTLI